MEKRSWLSNDKMFWNDNEWNEAYLSLHENVNHNQSNLDGTTQMQYLIGYLMQNYPVSKEQLKDAKEKYAD